MKHLKGFLFVIVAFCILITLVSLLMPSKLMVAKTVMINADKKKIMNAISDLNNWKYWHPVFMDSTAAISISDPSNGTNASATWNSNGKQNKILMIAGDSNQLQISLQRTGENDISNSFSLYPIRDRIGIQVEWRMITTLKWYPWEKFSGIFFDKMVGPGCEEALNNLKEYVEKGNRSIVNSQ